MKSLMRPIGALLSLVVAVSVAACGGTKPSGQTPDAAAAGGGAGAQSPLTKLSVRLDWSANALHAPIYAALEKGFYKQAGLDVTINPATDKDDVLKLVDTGVDSLGLYYGSSVLKAQSKGYHIQTVGAYVQHPLNVFLVDQRAGVKSLKDLEGKQVGFTSDPKPKGVLSTTAAALKNMVEKAGGNFEKIELVNVGDAGVQALAAQKVAALGGVYEYHEKFLLDKEGVKTDVYRLYENGAPDLYELAIVASEKTASEQAAAIQKFLKATEQGVLYTKEHSDEVADLLVKASPTLKKDLVKSALGVVLPLYTDGGQPFGTQSRDKWEAAAKWMVQNQLIKELPDLDKLLAK